jgi:uncharacterized protein
MDFRIRDPIHNFVVLPNEFQPLINSPAVQRLRGIRQLALACLVYPGALHTRFDHTLGVAHVAGMMADALKLNASERRLVQLAALLHDVGHGPFSHVSEASLARFADTASLKSEQKAEKIHELVTSQIICSDPVIGSILNEDEQETIVQLLEKGHGRPALRQVVSGPLDADKQDYLLRDSRFCGVEYGVFDLRQLQRSLVLVGEEGDEELMIDSDGVHAIEQFMLAKYYMTANVYRHRVRLITDQMIGRAIQLGVEIDQVTEMRALYCFDNSAEFIRNYQLWDDSRFMEVFCPLAANPPGTMSGALLRRLRQRQLLKQVYSERIELLDARCREMAGDLPRAALDSPRKEIERSVAEFLSKKLGCECPPEFVIAHSFGIKSVRESSRNDEAEIMVKGGGQPRSFTDESKLLGSINQAYSDDFVEIYAPIDWPDRETKDSEREKWRLDIRAVIESQCRTHRSNLRSGST